MNGILHKCRLADPNKNINGDIINTMLFLLLGIFLGVLAKCVDNLSINNEILWQKLLGIIDLRNILSRTSIWALLALVISVYSNHPKKAGLNVFVFFLGMLSGYYAITILVSGFFPKTYIVAWGIITLFTPILAFFTWYCKGKGWLALLLSSIIVGFFITQAISYGVGYFNIKYYPEFIFLIISIIVLFRDIKQLMFICIGGLSIAPIINNLLPYIFGGL